MVFRNLQGLVYFLGNLCKWSRQVKTVLTSCFFKYSIGALLPMYFLLVAYIMADLSFPYDKKSWVQLKHIQEYYSVKLGEIGRTA